MIKKMIMKWHLIIFKKNNNVMQRKLKKLKKK